MGARRDHLHRGDLEEVVYLAGAPSKFKKATRVDKEALEALMRLKNTVRSCARRCQAKRGMGPGKWWS